MDLRRILVGVDGSLAATAALRWAAAAAGESGEVVALHATGTTIITRANEPVEALLHHTRRKDPDVIVIGHGGSTGLLDRLFQDRSDQLLDQASRPVVVSCHPIRNARTRLNQKRRDDVSQRSGCGLDL